MNKLMNKLLITLEKLQQEFYFACNDPNTCEPNVFLDSFLNVFQAMLDEGKLN